MKEGTHSTLHKTQPTNVTLKENSIPHIYAEICVAKKCVSILYCHSDCGTCSFSGATCNLGTDN